VASQASLIAASEPPKDENIVASQASLIKGSKRIKHHICGLIFFYPNKAISYPEILARYQLVHYQKLP
jgi:hypothetical protein